MSGSGTGKYSKPGSNSKGRKPGKKEETDWAKEGRKARKAQLRKMNQADSAKMSAADQLQKASGGRGVDPRSPNHQEIKAGTQRLVVQTELSTIAQTAQISASAISTLALGPILLAVKHGWTGTAQGDIQVYPAWVFLTQAYLNAVKGIFPVIQAAPKWFWETVKMLGPKSAKFKTAGISYKWECDQPSTYVPPPVYPIAGVYGVALGRPVSATINGFPQIFLDPYFPTAGEDAITSLFQFFHASGLNLLEADPGDSCYLAKDVSAFQAIYSEWGSTSNGPSGMAITVESEVKLRCPVLAKFSPYQEFFWRGSQNLAKNAGTPCYIVPRISELKDMHQISNKCSPIFKFYNFDHFFITLSYILASALEEATQDNAQIFPGQCPLTSLQMQIVLRQALIARFNNEMAQDLVQDGGNTVAQIPFSVGPNGLSATNEAIGSLKLPFVFTENVRSATRLTTRLNKVSSVDWIPILSRPSVVDVPTLGNFQYFDGTAYQDVYKTVSGEVAIDLIDLGTGITPREYISANGDQLTTLITSFNKWITSLGNHLSTLCTIGSEPGIPALSTIINTLHTRTLLTPPPPTLTTAPTLTKRDSVQKIVHKGVGLAIEQTTLPRPAPGASEYYTKVAVNSVSGTCPFQAPLQRYLTAFVQPSFIGQLGFSAEATINFRRVYQIEPFTINYMAQLSPTVDGLDGMILFDTLAKKAALLDIKTNLAARSESEIELTKMSQGGEGGFFTSLAGVIGDMVGVPAVRAIADGVAKVWDV